MPSSPGLGGPAADYILASPIDCSRQSLKKLGGEDPVSTRATADVLDLRVIVILSEQSLQRRGADPEKSRRLLCSHLLTSC
jgi:hypothetical protein